MQYYALASQNGEAEASLALSKWYLAGSDDGSIEKDEVLAVTFAEKAARKGLVSAEFALGYYQEVGVGNGRRDLVEAKRWYERVSPVAFFLGSADGALVGSREGESGSGRETPGAQHVGAERPYDRAASLACRHPSRAEAHSSGERLESATGTSAAGDARDAGERGIATTGHGEARPACRGLSQLALDRGELGAERCGRADVGRRFTSTSGSAPHVFCSAVRPAADGTEHSTEEPQFLLCAPGISRRLAKSTCPIPFALQPLPACAVGGAAVPPHGPVQLPARTPAAKLVPAHRRREARSAGADEYPDRDRAA